MADGTLAIESSDLARYCVGCGYNLRGLESEQCPECGLKIDTENTSSIAWEHRRWMGWRKAFWTTVRLAIFDPKRLGEAAKGKVDYRAAMSFRRAVAVMAALPVMVVALFVQDRVRVAWDYGLRLLGSPITHSGHSIFWEWELPTIWMSGARFWPVAPMGILLIFLIGTAGWEHFVLPRKLSVAQRNAAMAVGGYACAPLVFLFIPLGFFLCAAFMYDGIEDGAVFATLFAGASFFGFASAMVLWILYMRVSSRLLRVSTGAGMGRTTMAAVLQIGRWFFAGAIGLFVWPSVAGLVLLMVESLR